MVFCQIHSHSTEGTCLFVLLSAVEGKENVPKQGVEMPGSTIPYPLKDEGQDRNRSLKIIFFSLPNDTCLETALQVCLVVLHSPSLSLVDLLD